MRMALVHRCAPAFDEFSDLSGRFEDVDDANARRTGSNRDSLSTDVSVTILEGCAVGEVKISASGFDQIWPTSS